MLQVARLAPNLLHDSAELVLRFIQSKIDPSGGFCNRAGSPDLYYTVFGIDSLLALRAPLPVPGIVGFVRSHGDIAALDLVHTACLARCDAASGRVALDDAARQRIADRLLAFRTPDGSFANESGRTSGTAYGAFVALGALEDLGERARYPDDAVSGFLDRLVRDDGSYPNEIGVSLGMTNSTAAAVNVLRAIQGQQHPSTPSWLRARFNDKGGGFFAGPGVPLPDLLSTATTLHTLAALETPIDDLREACLDFIDTLWTNEGSFYAHWADETIDVEYTYYGLLALGHLAVGERLARH
jgi:prenyltransferase beta subunit